MRAVLTVAIVLVAGVARADTLLPEAFVGGGGMLGGIDSLVGTGTEVEVGYHLSGAMYAHGEVASGTGAPVFGQGPGSFYEARVGFEYRSCTHPTATLCFTSGLDVGYLHSKFDGEVGVFAKDGEQWDWGVAVFAPRALLDIGSDRLRFRPGIELPITTDGELGFQVTGTVAVAF